MLEFTRRTLLALAAVAAALAAAPAARADDARDARRSDGYIRVGFANEAPFGFATPDGKLTGEAPEVAKAVLAKMGITQVDGVLTEFGSLIPGLQAGRFDIIAAGMFVNPTRCEQVPSPSPPTASARRSWCRRATRRASTTTARSPRTAT